MAVEHIVLFKFKSDIPPDLIRNVFSQLDNLRSIPFVKSLRYGESFTPSAYSHALIVTLETKDQLREYNTHSAYQLVLSQLRVITEEVLTIDFENDSIGE